MEKAQHGGDRRNSGRRTEMVGEPTHKVTITIDHKTKALLEVVGEGNISKGVRVAARLAYDRYQNTA